MLHTKLQCKPVVFLVAGITKILESVAFNNSCMKLTHGPSFHPYLFRYGKGEQYKLPSVL